MYIQAILRNTPFYRYFHLLTKHLPSIFRISEKERRISAVSVVVFFTRTFCRLHNLLVCTLHCPFFSSLSCMSAFTTTAARAESPPISRIPGLSMPCTALSWTGLCACPSAFTFKSFLSRDGLGLTAHPTVTVYRISPTSTTRATTAHDKATMSIVSMATR